MCSIPCTASLLRFVVEEKNLRNRSSLLFAFVDRFRSRKQKKNVYHTFDGNKRRYFEIMSAVFAIAYSFNSINMRQFSLVKTNFVTSRN